MTRKAWLILGAALFPFGITTVSSGCKTDVTVVSPAGTGGEAGAGGFLFLDAGSSSGGSTMNPPDGSLPDYEDPGCPNKPPPLEQFDCDPYLQGNGDCPAGEGCYIFVDYPTEPCGQEIYGSFCSPEGGGQQGDSCGGGMDCAGGYVCLITGSGTQCAQLCQLAGESGCPPGLVCEPIDVVGFGGCL